MWLNMKQRGDGMSSGYLDRQPHKTYVGKHTLPHSAPVEGEGVRPVRNCMKQINISTPSAARWISMIVYFHRLSPPPLFFFLTNLPRHRPFCPMIEPSLHTCALLTNSVTVVKIAMRKEPHQTKKHFQGDLGLTHSASWNRRTHQNRPV